MNLVDHLSLCAGFAGELCNLKGAWLVDAVTLLRAQALEHFRVHLVLYTATLRPADNGISGPHGESRNPQRDAQSATSTASSF